MQDKYTRKLAAILFADIVGYTASMEKSEDLARGYIKKFKEVFHRETTLSNGKIIQFYGDACVCLFESSVNAVDCALKIQSAFLSYPTVPVRIGLHSGDVYMDDDNVYGDSVNIASRIESTGIPGSVLFSERIKKDIENKDRFTFLSLGPHRFKNVANPVVVFALNMEGLVVPVNTVIGANPSTEPHLKSGPKRRNQNIVLVLVLIGLIIVSIGLRNWIADPADQNVPSSEAGVTRTSIAVLPFLDLSPQQDQLYFSDGVAEEILNQLARINELKVIARTSSFSFRTQEISIRSIGEQLGADYVLEGSVKKEQDKLNISVRMIDARDESLVWTETFNRDLGSAMRIQSDIARTISYKIDPSIPSIKISQLIKANTDNFEAYDLFLKARYEVSNGSFERSIELLESAQSLDSFYADVYTLLAWNYMAIGNGWLESEVDRSTAYMDALSAINRSLQLDSVNSVTFLVRGAIKMFMEWDFEGAERDFIRALGVGQWPNATSSFCFCSYIGLLQSTGRPEKALELLEKVMEFDPLYHFESVDRGQIKLLMGDREGARIHFENSISENEKSTGFKAFWSLGILYTLEQKYDMAIETVQKGILEEGRTPHLIATLGIAEFHSGRYDEFEKINMELKARQLAKENKTSIALAILHAGIGDDEGAIHWLEKAYDERESDLVYLNVEPVFAHLHNNRTFQELVRKIGLN